MSSPLLKTIVFLIYLKVVLLVAAVRIKSNSLLAPSVVTNNSTILTNNPSTLETSTVIGTALGSLVQLQSTSNISDMTIAKTAHNIHEFGTRSANRESTIDTIPNKLKITHLSNLFNKIVSHQFQETNLSQPVSKMKTPCETLCSRRVNKSYIEHYEAVSNLGLAIISTTLSPISRVQHPHDSIPRNHDPFGIQNVNKSNKNNLITDHEAPLIALERPLIKTSTATNASYIGKFNLLPSFNSSTHLQYGNHTLKTSSVYERDFIKLLERSVHENNEEKELREPAPPIISDAFQMSSKITNKRAAAPAYFRQYLPKKNISKMFKNNKKNESFPELVTNNKLKQEDVNNRRIFQYKDSPLPGTQINRIHTINLGKIPINYELDNTRNLSVANNEELFALNKENSTHIPELEDILKERVSFGSNPTDTDVLHQTGQIADDDLILSSEYNINDEQIPVELTVNGSNIDEDTSQTLLTAVMTNFRVEKSRGSSSPDVNITGKKHSPEETFLKSTTPGVNKPSAITTADVSGVGTGVIVATVFGVIITALLFMGIFLLILCQRKSYKSSIFVGTKGDYAGSDSGGYLDDQCQSSYTNSHIDIPKGCPDDLISLDNDSFLNSIESMTIQNLWTDSIKHTKL